MDQTNHFPIYIFNETKLSLDTPFYIKMDLKRI